MLSIIISTSSDWRGLLQIYITITNQVYCRAASSLTIINNYLYYLYYFIYFIVLLKVALNTICQSVNRSVFILRYVLHLPSNLFDKLIRHLQNRNMIFLVRMSFGHHFESVVFARWHF